MTSNTDRLAMARSVIAAMELDPVEHAELLAELGPTAHCPTFGDSIPAFLVTLSPNTRTTYATGLKAFRTPELASASITDFTVDDLDQILGDAACGRSRRGGTERSDAVYTTSVTAVRAYARWLAAEPGMSINGINTAIHADLKGVWDRDPEARHALNADQVGDWFDVAIAASTDPLLTATALQLVRETAVRRGTTLVGQDTVTASSDWLRLGGIPPERLLDYSYLPEIAPVAVLWMPKPRRYILQRLTRGLTYSLLCLRERATTAEGLAYPLLQKNGRPITKKFWELQGRKLDEACPWAADLELGPHYLRHTTLTDVRASTDERVAIRYGGHKPPRNDPNGYYTKATTAEAHAAHKFLFGD